MRIHVQSLPFNQDFSTEFQVPAEVLAVESTKHGEAEIHFSEPTDCKATLRKMTGDEVLLQLSADTIIEPICDRCTESYKLPVHMEATLLCRPLTHKPTVEEEEDEGLVFFTKQELYLDRIVREQILLTLPIQFVCTENCKGLCTGCGENLNLEPSTHSCNKAAFFECKAKVL